MTQIVKTKHNSAFKEIHFFAPLCFGHLKLYIVAISSLYSKLQAVKARDAIHGFVRFPMAIKITRI